MKVLKAVAVQVLKIQFLNLSRSFVWCEQTNLQQSREREREREREKEREREELYSLNLQIYC